MFLDRDFLRGAFEANEHRLSRADRRRLRRLIGTPGALDLLAYQINNGVEIALEPPEDRTFGGWLAWFVNNLPELLAALQKIIDFLSQFGEVANATTVNCCGANPDYEVNIATAQSLAGLAAELRPFNGESLRPVLTVRTADLLQSLSEFMRASG